MNGRNWEGLIMNEESSYHWSDLKYAVGAKIMGELNAKKKRGGKEETNMEWGGGGVLMTAELSVSLLCFVTY